MLGWAIFFLIIAIVAGLIGFIAPLFTEIAGIALWIAKILFVAFLIIFIISLFFGRGS